MNPTQESELNWGSHLPALLACVGSTVGKVIELGVGHFSTPHLHALCGAENRLLVSVEADKDWFNLLADRFATDSIHEFRHGQYNEILPGLLAEGDVAVVFIDSSPGGSARAELFEMALQKAQYVVMHDAHLENEKAVMPILEILKVKNFAFCGTYSPPTLVASLRRKIPQSIIGL